MAALEAATARINGTPGQPHSFRALHRLLEEQAYRLAYWRVASSEINYRRFFEINELAGLRMERPEVFEATHKLLLRLIADGKVQGVRLDHIDGLYDPKLYCERLLARVAEVLPRPEAAPPPALDAKAGQPIWLLVEKILARHEYLREDLEHQNVIERRPATPRAISPRHGPLELAPEQLEVDHRSQPLEVVALPR